MAQSQECSGHSLAGGFPHCEWMKPSVDGRPVECGLQFQSVDAFLTHTREHILMDSPAGVLGEGDGGNSLPLSCLWKNCGWQADQRSDLVVHILYHPYHSFLKHLGRGVVAKKSLPPCTYSSECCNILPELEGGFECLWDQCGEVFDSAWDFYEHVGGHVRGSAGNGQGGYKCMWQDCTFTGKAMSKLLEHTHVHTQRKAVACPTCGCLFASNTKLVDHLQRQLAGTSSDYVCQYCSKTFSTNRLLRSHIQTHINKYQCPHCEMTCPTKSGLESHIQWRHSKIKSFACQVCQKAFKTEAVLKRHLETHSQFTIDCAFSGCDFVTNSAQQYKLHLEKNHLERGDSEASFACHECGLRFVSGSLLSGHLREAHSYQPLPGHTRFRYITCPDGLKRLQTVRLDKISLA